ncbi:MAG: HD domain-containing protein [Patescibacteria group bacterium]
MNNLKKITNLIYEAAVVARLKRTGWQILGDNEESLGEHIFMTAVIAYILGRQLKVNLEKVLVMAVFHDFHEGRVGEIDKIALRYITRDIAKANRDIFTEVEPKLVSLLSEYEAKKTREAQVVYEANIIALLVELKQLVEKGNIHAQEWLEANSKRLKLPAAINLAQTLTKTSSQDWWKDIRADLHREFAK